MSYKRWIGNGLSVGACVALLSSLAHGQDRENPGVGADPRVSTGAIAPRLEGLGEHHFEVSTESEEAQAFFDQGLALLYAFNHGEALRAFEEAARLDPQCAMAYWGQAYALGPHLNQMMQAQNVAPAKAAIEIAQRLGVNATEKEKAFIDALAPRYSAGIVDDRSAYDQAYADAMGKLYAAYPEDDDAATLYADALMNLMPWDYWTPDGKPKPLTTDVLQLLESVAERNPHHAGAHHAYIHAVEAVYPERAEKNADILATLMPGAGHIVHMPSHIYMQIGRFEDAYESNRLAVLADEGYITQCRQQGIYPMSYYPHNVHFMAWAAQRDGRSDEAIRLARKVGEKAKQSMAGEHFALHETFFVFPLFMQVRFGKWDDLLAEPRPEVDNPFINGAWHYAQGLAQLAKGERRQAAKHLGALDELIEPADELGLTAGFAPHGLLLTIASEILGAEWELSRKNYDVAIAKLERAVRLEDGLAYNEPPDWYYPIRHSLGAALLEAGRPDEAATVYWEDLRRNPENGLSLFGVWKSYEARGMDEQAAMAQKRFMKAWSDADFTPTSSRY